MKFTDLVKSGQAKSGNYGGRPPIDKNRVNEVIHLWKNGLSYRQIEKLTGVSKATIQKYINQYQQMTGYVKPEGQTSKS